MRGRPLSLRKGAVVLAVLAVSACTHENARPVEPAAVSPPIENYVLRAEPSIIAPGVLVTLHWSIPGATRVSIDATGATHRELQHVGTFGGSGEVQVKPAEDTMYVISCEGSTTISCASVSVRVRVNEP